MRVKKSIQTLSSETPHNRGFPAKLQAELPFKTFHGEREGMLWKNWNKMFMQLIVSELHIGQGVRNPIIVSGFPLFRPPPGWGIVWCCFPLKPGKAGGKPLEMTPDRGNPEAVAQPSHSQIHLPNPAVPPSWNRSPLQQWLGRGMLCIHNWSPEMVVFEPPDADYDISSWDIYPIEINVTGKVPYSLGARVLELWGSQTSDNISLQTCMRC